MMFCPFCHRPTEKFEREARDGAVTTQRCPHLGCKKIVPWEFANDYASHPPMLFSMIGMTSHGKTTFMHSLKLALEELGQQWPGFSKSARIVGSFRQGAQALATRAGAKQDPEFLTLSGVPRVGGCQLLMYDTGGENFNRVENIIQFVDYTLHSQCIIWLVGLVNLVVLPPEVDPHEVLASEAGMDVVIHDPPASLGLSRMTADGKRRILYELGREKLDEMLRNYRTAMLSQNGRLKNQSLVVVLTKGDYLSQILEGFPEQANEFLLNDDLDPAGDAWDRLSSLSNVLEKWMVHQGYHNFIHNARQYFRSIQFCVSSSYSPNMELRPMPRGVLAPLFWLWRQQRPAVWVEADGKRLLYFSIAEAFAEAPSGATVRLESGRYVLSEQLIFDKSLRLAGATDGETIIELRSSRGDALLIDTDGSVILSHLKFEYVGDGELQSLLHAPRGRLTAHGCGFIGSVVGKGSRVKAGVLIRQQTIGDFSACEFRHNQVGLALIQNSSGAVVNCTIQQNSSNGLMVRDAANFRIEASRLSGNGHGIFCSSSMKTVVFNCELWKNVVGIKVSDGIATISDNSVRENGKEGISLGNAFADVVKNIVERNGGSGILISGGSDGAIEHNKIFNNFADGIRLKDVALCKLFQNECARNEAAGIRVEGSAAPLCRENPCHHNKGDGMVARQESKPELRANTCESNGGDGLKILDAARPALDRNTLVNNNGYGVTIERAAKPSGVRGTTLRGNKKGDKNDQRTMW